MVGKFITNNSSETSNLGTRFAKSLKAGDVLLLFGDLGAGKTTFVQGLAKGLGIKERILSPTFVLQRIHNAKKSGIKTFNHVDLYRLEGKQAIETLGLSETMNDPEGVVAIEWADRLSDFKPDKGYELRFDYLDEAKRKITINKV